MNENLVIVRGGGDIATGTIHRLARCGFKVVVLETGEPTVIRRTVSFASAIYDGEVIIEGIKAIRVDSLDEGLKVLEHGNIPIFIDENGSTIDRLEPEVVVDAILAKRNLGTCKDMAPIVIGLGPGFIAGQNVHAVIETNRGHYLGSVILKGKSETNTGIPGKIEGYSWERVIRSSSTGIIRTIAQIGDIVEKGECVGYINDIPVLAPLNGVLRGLIQNGIYVTENFKIGDVDPRGEVSYCFSISDKARAVAGGVLEAILTLRNLSCSS